MTTEDGHVPKPGGLEEQLLAMFRTNTMTSIYDTMAKSTDRETTANTARWFYSRLGRKPEEVEEAISIANEMLGETPE